MKLTWARAEKSFKQLSLYKAVAASKWNFDEKLGKIVCALSGWMNTKLQELG